MITMQQAASLLGLPKPAAHRQRVCASCEGELVWGYVERSGRNAYLSDFERLAEHCEECGAEVEA